MPKLVNRLPAMKLHKDSGQSVVWYGGKGHYLGKHGSPEAREKYERLMAEWIKNGRKLEKVAVFTVSELLVRFARHANEHYRNKRGEPTGEAKNLGDACKPLRRLFGSKNVIEFTPDDLDTVRTHMIGVKLARTTINARINRIRRVFRWGVAKSLVPETTFRALKTLDGLEEGRTTAREAPPIRAVAPELVTETLPHMSPIVSAMVQVQLLTGARPTEIAILRPCDVDRSDKQWKYQPSWHKTEHRRKNRVIAIGPQARAILGPLLAETKETGYVFDPRKTVDGIRKARQGGRPIEKTATRYDRRTYRQAVVRACDRAFPHPTLSKVDWELLTKAQKAELKAWRKRYRWSPNQLRKTQATLIRKLYGLEAAQKVLGHAKADVTQLYAEADMEQVTDIMEEIG